MVYNVTPYIDYHPGGEDELMKAAGIDGTDLFDQVEIWRKNVGVAICQITKSVLFLFVIQFDTHCFFFSLLNQSPV